jgi:hypothetical protein
MTDGQLVSLSWSWAPSGAHDQILLDSYILSMSGAPSDEGTGLSFVIVLSSKLSLEL